MSNAPGYGCARQGKIKSLEQIYLFSLPVKEYQIVEAFLGSALKDEVMKIMPVQKQTRAGQRTRFKARHAALVMPRNLLFSNMPATHSVSLLLGAEPLALAVRRQLRWLRRV